MTGEGEPHGKLTYILAGVTMFLLLLTALWATLIIRLRQPPPANLNMALQGMWPLKRLH